MRLNASIIGGIAGATVAIVGATTGAQAILSPETPNVRPVPPAAVLYKAPEAIAVGSAAKPSPVRAARANATRVDVAPAIPLRANSVLPQPVAAPVAPVPASLARTPSGSDPAIVTGEREIQRQAVEPAPRAKVRASRERARLARQASNSRPRQPAQRRYAGCGSMGCSGFVMLGVGF